MTRRRPKGGQAAMRFIIVSGVLVFAFLLLTAMLLKRNEGERASPGDRSSPFDGKRAFRDLERIVGLGPRASGSPELDQLRGIIRRELETVGLEVREQAFRAETPIGSLKMVNIWGTVKGTRPGVIVLGNHYETKYFPEFRFVGANDGGSSTAWMIEMARAIGPSRDGRSLWLVFFDGEEAFKEWSRDDSLYGSRAFVEHLRSRGELSQAEAMINVDMIGDRYLGIKREPDAPTWLALAIWDTARRLGYGKHFLSGRRAIQDDHIPFRAAGIPAVNIIDFEYGGSIVDHANIWHTPNDTLDKVCAESLQVVGDVIYHAFPDIEANLDRSARDGRGPS